MNKEAIMGRAAWRSAKGVKGKRGETNRALAERDYTKECATTSTPIVVFEGYWFWWCTTHYQPLAWCDKRVKPEGGSIKDIKGMAPNFTGGKSSVEWVRERRRELEK